MDDWSGMVTKTVPASTGPFDTSNILRQKAERFRSLLMRWAREHGRAFPWRSTSNPFKTVIAEMLLQRTRSSQVVPIYKRLIARYPSPMKLAEASPRAVGQILYPLGLAFRAKMLVNLAQKIMKEHEAKPPTRAEEVITLPGVGPYTAAAVDAFLNGRRLPVVDTNVARTISRVFAVGRPDWRRATAEERRRIFATTLLSMGRIHPRKFYYALLDFAATVCSSSPRCPDCPMHRAGVCAYCLTVTPKYERKDRLKKGRLR